MSAHPLPKVRAYLEGLVHDGHPRLDAWLPHALRVTPYSAGAEHHQYLSLVGRYLLLGMVQRALHPGCKLDHSVVLAGAPGTFKSTLLQVLAGGADHVGTAPLDLSGVSLKAACEQLEGLWLYELNELPWEAPHVRAEVLKSFITGQVDHYRASYAPEAKRVPRHCVFVFTTGDRHYLSDEEPGRRFWPVPVHSPINIEWVRIVRDQLFAEAMVQYYEGALLWPTPEEEARVFAPAQRAAFDHGGVAARLRQVLDRAPSEDAHGEVHRDVDFVTLSALFRALNIDASRFHRGLELAIRQWLERQGWRRAKGRINGIRIWGYRRPGTEAATAEAPDALPPALRTPAPAEQPAMSRPAAHPSTTGPAAAPPRGVRHAQSLLRLLGLHSTWTPSNGDKGASLVIRRAPRLEKRS